MLLIKNCHKSQEFNPFTVDWAGERWQWALSFNVLMHPFPGGRHMVVYGVWCIWYLFLLFSILYLVFCIAQALNYTCAHFNFQLRKRASAKKCKLGWQVKVSRNLVNYRLKLLSGSNPAYFPPTSPAPYAHYPFQHGDTCCSVRQFPGSVSKAY